jgi:malate dehydrogenase (oxaloacetate-decarboxylating)(NADP+)
MKLAASEARAELARAEFPEEVRAELKKAYPADAAKGVFDTPAGLRREMVIPKPFDPRVVPHVARKVAEAAMKSGVAQIIIDDLDAYEAEGAARIAASRAE